MYYGSVALRWALAAFSVSLSYTQSVGLLERGISPSQSFYLHTEQHKHRLKARNTDIHALSGIQSHDPSVRARESVHALDRAATVIGFSCHYQRKTLFSTFYFCIAYISMSNVRQVVAAQHVCI
jgi:hypothetical protein